MNQIINSVLKAALVQLIQNSDVNLNSVFNPEFIKKVFEDIRAQGGRFVFGVPGPNGQVVVQELIFQTTPQGFGLVPRTLSDSEAAQVLRYVQTVQAESPSASIN